MLNFLNSRSDNADASGTAKTSGWSKNQKSIEESGNQYRKIILY